MAKFKLVGTSHISPESLRKVEETIRKLQPTIVAIELDRKRLIALSHPDKQGIRLRDIGRVGVKGWLFAVVGAWVERKLGEKVGVSPGAEMLKAVELAKEVKAQVALIDQDIEITLRRLSASLTWKEKGRFVVDIVKAAFGRGMKIDLAKVPEKQVIEKLLGEVKVRYPSVHKVLVEERNVVMARNLAALARHLPESTVVAVVGAGHEKEIIRLLKTYLNVEKKEEGKSVKKEA